MWYAVYFILNTVGVLRGQLPTEHSHGTNQSSSSSQLMGFGSFGQIWRAHSHALDWGASQFDLLPEQTDMSAEPHSFRDKCQSKVHIVLNTKQQQKQTGKYHMYDLASMVWWVEDGCAYLRRWHWDLVRWWANFAQNAKSWEIYLLQLWIEQKRKKPSEVNYFAN